MEAAFKYRIYPNQEQITLIQKTFGCARFVYNHFLEERIKTYKETGKTPTFFDQSKEFTIYKEDKPWLNEVDLTALRYSLKHLYQAYQNFFRRVKNGEQPGFPKFKSRLDHNQSYTTGGCIRVDDKKIRLPKLGWVKAVVSRPIQGRILNATVSQTPSGKYFVSICCTDVEVPQYLPTGKQVGLDLGLKNLVTDSDGNMYENIQALLKSERKLVRLQKQLSRKNVGGKNYEKARLKLAKLHEHIANQRLDSLHKLSTMLVREYDTICIENFDIKKMLKDRRYAKAISDASWGEFIRQLTYKVQFHGKELIQIDRFFPSNQVCSICGFQNKTLHDSTVAKWTCPNCGAVHDRHINSARVVLQEGLRQTYVQNALAG